MLVIAESDSTLTNTVETKFGENSLLANTALTNAVRTFFIMKFAFAGLYLSVAECTVYMYDKN